MTGISALWLPILLSAVIVFVASSVIHMVLGFWHKDDFRRVPDEEKFRNVVGPLALPPGDYCVPRAGSMEEMKSDAFKAKHAQGPVMIFTVLPSGPITMTKQLTGWFVYTIVVGILVAYLASRALPAGAHYLHVFRVTSVTAFVAYAAALWPQSIWYGRSWGTTIRTSIDGFAYALLTGGVFGWLWPR
jgi:hypothetical protein